MNNANLLESKATGNAGCFQRRVKPLLHGKPMMTMWVIIACINIASQNVCGAYNALAVLWFIYAYESAYRNRQRPNEKLTCSEPAAGAHERKL